MTEMVSKLAALISKGQTDIIDLRHEPLTLNDIGELKALLGQGEIDVTLKSLGSSRVYETAVPGIWWISHFNEQGDVTSEFIEITLCPDLIKTFPDDLHSAVARLQEKIHQYSHRLTPDQVNKRLQQLGLAKPGVETKLN